MSLEGNIAFQFRSSCLSFVLGGYRVLARVPTPIEPFSLDVLFFLSLQAFLTVLCLIFGFLSFQVFGGGGDYGCTYLFFCYPGILLILLYVGFSLEFINCLLWTCGKIFINKIDFTYKVKPLLHMYYMAGIPGYGVLLVRGKMRF